MFMNHIPRSQVLLLLILFIIRSDYSPVLVTCFQVFHRIDHFEHHYGHHFNASFLCPVTSLYRKIDPLKNTYPLDFIPALHNDEYPCFFEIAKLHVIPHTCSQSSHVCPNEKHFLPIAMRYFEGRSSQICHSLHAMKQGEHVRMIIFGGSVAIGYYANGCYKGDCINLNATGTCDWNHECNWHRGVFEFLQNKFTNKQIERFNFAERGTSTCTAERFLLHKFHQANITSLSNHDIIFWDYSPNDAVAYQVVSKLRKLKNCLINVLLELYSYTNDQWPTIILLEYLPFKGLMFSSPTTVDTDLQYRYVSIYREVAEMFHIPILSYHDLIWSEEFHKTIHPKYPLFESYAKYEWAADNDNVDIHPPWMVHNFYADVIASVLTRVDHICAVRNEFIVEGKPPDIDVLEGGGSSCSKMNQCVMLQAFTASTTTSLSLEDADELPYGWKLYQDRPGKPGWIITGTPSPASNVTDSVIVMTDANPSFSRDVMTFRFSVDNPKMVQILIEISYMATYKNAGAFRAALCGMDLVNQWPEHKIILDTLMVEHLTTQEVSVYDVNLDFTCKKKRANLDLTIRHLILNDTVDGKRGNHKVKITSVQVMGESTEK